ncbi:MAG: thioredoxin family protein [Bacteroidales bacterium]|nr:thioredoxin family protein [Bacteroidales bacterium]
MNLKDLKSLDEFNSVLEAEDGVLIYFSHEQCNVCKVLKPKIVKLLDENFPSMKMFYADTVKASEIAGQNGIFTVPAVVCFFGGKETFRKSRNIGIEELRLQIKRPYDMVFGS